MQRFSNANLVWILLLALFSLSYFFGIGSMPFIGPDEPRYAQVAREMFLRSDWITPTLGGHTWFEKPALVYWMMISSYRLFGVSEFSARIGPTLCGVLTFIFLYPVALLTEKLTDGRTLKLATLAPLTLASSAGMIVFSKAVNFDITLTFAVTVSLCSFLLWDLLPRNDRGNTYLALFYIGMGLALLAKGLVGLVLPVGVIFGYFVINTRFPDRSFIRSVIWGIPLTVAVSAVWYGPAIYRNGRTFIYEFFVQHHLARYLTDKYHHTQRFYFYFEIIWLLLLPWMIPFVFGFLVRRLRFGGSDVPLLKLRSFAISWLLIPILFFSLSGSKLPGYILPSLPGAAILIYLFLRQFLREEASAWPVRTTGAVVAILAGSAAYALWHLHLAKPGEVLVLSAPGVFAGILVLFISSHRAAAVNLIFASILWLILISSVAIAPKVAAQHSMKGLLEAANRNGYGSVPVLEMHAIERTTEFYASDRVRRTSEGEVEKLEGVSQVLEIAEREGGKVLVTVPTQFSDQLIGTDHFDSEVIGTNNEFALVAVRIKNR